MMEKSVVMVYRELTDIKNINIGNCLKNKKTKGYYINLKDKKVLNKILKRYHKVNLFAMCKMSYICEEREDSILLIIYKDFFI